MMVTPEGVIVPAPRMHARRTVEPSGAGTGRGETSTGGALEAVLAVAPEAAPPRRAPRRS